MATSSKQRKQPQQQSRFDLPGFTLPLNYSPGDFFENQCFPNALEISHIEAGFIGTVNTMRELTMMQIMNTIIEKPEWERKVFDEKITSRWTTEISKSGKDVTPKMIEWILAELKHKATVFKETGMVTAFNPGVVRSDSAIPKELQAALQKAMKHLEDVPEEERDYHPGSDNQVLDLVHPSLFPVVYGRSQILKNEVIRLDNCWSWSGQAELLPTPPEEDAIMKGQYGTWALRRGMKAYSTKFQWLPCDVQFIGGDDDANKCQIASYVNNLHPKNNYDLYQVIEQIIAKTIPLWDETLHDAVHPPSPRISYDDVEYLDYDVPEPDYDDFGRDRVEEYLEARRAWGVNRPIIMPEPEGEFDPSKRSRSYLGPWIPLSDKFRDSGLQVIVKLANIELTPGKPRYEGGSWHVEGQLNEHICATAVYYYSSENITHSSLSFRQRAIDDLMDLNYPQSEHDFLYSVYGFGPDVDGNNDCNITQELGSVSCLEGRLLTFPNVLQHRVAPFELADKSKPGSRKILALFLVDPHIRIISSANVPPQREDWWAEEKMSLGQDLFSKKDLPVELQQMIKEELEGSPMTIKEAKELRLELMEERTAVKGQQNEMYEIGSFSLCEH